MGSSPISRATRTRRSPGGQHADDPRRDLPEIACLVVVLWGARDAQLRLQDAFEYARRLRARLRVVADHGYLVIVERPHAVVDALEALCVSRRGSHRQPSVEAELSASRRLSAWTPTRSVASCPAATKWIPSLRAVCRLGPRLAGEEEVVAVGGADQLAGRAAGADRDAPDPVGTVSDERLAA